MFHMERRSRNTLIIIIIIIIKKSSKYGEYGLFEYLLLFLAVLNFRSKVFTIVF